MIGRPSKYKPEFVDQCYKLCLLGHTDRELGDFFGVADSQICRWADKYPEFGDARAEGKSVADSKVAQALYKRALGGQTVVKQKLDKFGDIHDLTEELPVDVRACETWLSSRRGDKWNPKQQVEHSGQVQTDMTFLMTEIFEENEDISPLPSIAK